MHGGKAYIIMDECMSHTVRAKLLCLFLPRAQTLNVLLPVDSHPSPLLVVPVQVEVPQYDFTTHSRSKETKRVEPAGEGEARQHVWHVLTCCVTVDMYGHAPST